MLNMQRKNKNSNINIRYIIDYITSRVSSPILCQWLLKSKSILATCKV